MKLTPYPRRLTYFILWHSPWGGNIVATYCVIHFWYCNHGNINLDLLISKETLLLTQVTKSTPPRHQDGNHHPPNSHLPNLPASSSNIPNTSTPLKNTPVPASLKESFLPDQSTLKRSASDVDVGRRPSQNNS